MITLFTLNYADDAKKRKSQPGVFVVHSKTHMPLAMGDTPFSSMLRSLWRDGIVFGVLNRIGERDVHTIKPRDYESFSENVAVFLATGGYAVTITEITPPLRSTVTVDGEELKLSGVTL